MAYKIAIASGKGGTGKTTVAVSVYQYLSKDSSLNVQLVDCDVEEPNDVIFFPEALNLHQEEVIQKVPEIDLTKCTFCRKCAEYCEYNAIVVLPKAEFAEVNSSLCHSCGACMVACEHGAIKEYDHTIGMVSSYKTTLGKGLMEGKLQIGSPMQTMVIKELKKRVPATNDIVIYDAPPGTSCSVVETTIDADYVLLVTEPTPFGLHDLKLTVELMQDLNKDFGIIVNKAGLGDDETYRYIKDHQLELVGEIPFASSFASNYAQGNLVKNTPNEIEYSLNAIAEKLILRVLVHEGDNHTQR